MITVHHLNNSRSQRVLWLLEELGLEYEIKRYERDPKTMLAPPELRAVHPLGKSPVITDGDADARRVRRDHRVPRRALRRRPAGARGRHAGAPALHLLAALRRRLGMPPLLLKLVFDRIEKAPMPFFVRPIARAIAGERRDAFIEPQIKLHLDYMESELGKSLVRRRGVHCRRHPDELSARGGRGARRIGLAMAETDGFSQAHPRAARVQAGD